MDLLHLMLQRMRNSRGSATFATRLGTSRLIASSLKIGYRRRRKEMTNKRRSSKHEEFVYMGDGSKVKVDFFWLDKAKIGH